LSLVKWLRWLRGTCYLQLEKFMVDCSVTEREAIKAVFLESAQYLCHFHVGQAWETNMIKHGIKDKEAIKMREYLKKLRKVESKEQLKKEWDQIKASFPTKTKFHA
ncbi:hypothetical protein BGZ49_005070, partial [Haplosporangium sp. Z 27]